MASATGEKRVRESSPSLFSAWRDSTCPLNPQVRIPVRGGARSRGGRPRGPWRLTRAEPGLGAPVFRALPRHGWHLAVISFSAQALTMPGPCRGGRHHQARRRESVIAGARAEGSPGERGDRTHPPGDASRKGRARRSARAASS